MMLRRKRQRIKKCFNREIPSPLRYPGGKSKSLDKIVARIYPNYREFREPLVGGGSVFLAAMQRINSSAIYKIGDLNYEIFCFWKELKENSAKLIEEICLLKDGYGNGKELFEFLTLGNKIRTDLERAARFFVLNRITFSGTTESGGYSEEAFKKRFTHSSIQRLELLPKLLEKVEVRFGDYENLLLESGSQVFIFLDPPYYKPAKSKLYGKNGDLHTTFDHVRFAQNLKRCSHKWLITYDDCQEVRDLFSFANICEWEAQYGMNNTSIEGKAKKGNELFITNYQLRKTLFQY